MAAAVGVIGVGNMGSALVKGWLRAGRSELVVWDKYRPAVDALLESCHSTGEQASVEWSTPTVAESLAQLVDVSKIIVVLVKPKDAKELLSALGRLVRPDQIVVSAMAGLTLQWLRESLGPGAVLFRVMPNLAVELGAGAVAVAAEEGVDPAILEQALALFGETGISEALPEDLFDVFTAVSGSSPAFLAAAIEGLEDGAVAVGLARADARRVVRRAALETARLLAEHGGSSVELKRSLVDSGRLSADTVALMEERGLDLAFRDAVAAAMERSREMQKA